MLDVCCVWMLCAEKDGGGDEDISLHFTFSLELDSGEGIASGEDAERGEIFAESGAELLFVIGHIIPHCRAMLTAVGCLAESSSHPLTTPQHGRERE